MQRGIFLDWPAFLSQVVHPESSISAEIIITRLALLYVSCRHLLMRRTEVDLKFGKDPVALYGRNR